MSHPSRPRPVSLAAGVALALTIPLAAVAQSEDASEGSELPDIEGLGWYTSLEVTGEDIGSTFSAEEVEQWQATLEVAGASLEDLEYTYQQVVDPATLPQLGGLATVTIDGAAEADVLAAVLADISAQAASLGAEPPPSEPITLGEQEVTRVDLPEALGPDDAYVYVSGDTAWVFIMQESLAELALRGLP